MPGSNHRKLQHNQTNVPAFESSVDLLSHSIRTRHTFLYYRTQQWRHKYTVESRYYLLQRTVRKTKGNIQEIKKGEKLQISIATSETALCACIIKGGMTRSPNNLRFKVY